MSNASNPQEIPVSAAAGFCQQCGQPLDQHTIRRVGTAVFCEPCLAARLGTAAVAGQGPAAGPAAGSGFGGPVYGAQGYGGSAYGPGGAGSAWQPGARSNGFTPGDLGRSGPNPARAFLLGLIPGVGAMYNEQYDKGLVHLIIFVVLESLSRVIHPLDVLVAGWVFYMAIEAHHTARARRDGTPLPNPFGLNDIGMRMGFERWGQAGPHPPATPTPGRPAPTPEASAAPPDAASWGAPAEVYPHTIYARPRLLSIAGRAERASQAALRSRRRRCRLMEFRLEPGIRRAPLRILPRRILPIRLTHPMHLLPHRTELLCRTTRSLPRILPIRRSRRSSPLSPVRRGFLSRLSG